MQNLALIRKSNMTNHCHFYQSLSIPSFLELNIKFSVSEFGELFVSIWLLTTGACVDPSFPVPVTQPHLRLQLPSCVCHSQLTFGLVSHGIFKQPFDLGCWGCFRESPTPSRGTSADLAPPLVGRKCTTFLLMCPISKCATPILIKITQFSRETLLMRPQFLHILPESFCSYTSLSPLLFLICCRCCC